jgi:hypothetical protein
MITSFRTNWTFCIRHAGKFIYQYSVEAGRPKLQGQNRDPIFRKVICREKKSRWIKKLEKNVTFIQEHPQANSNTVGISLIISDDSRKILSIHLTPQTNIFTSLPLYSLIYRPIHTHKVPASYLVL